VLVKRVEAYLKTIGSLTAQDRNNLRFYVAAYVAWMLSGRVDPSADDISKIDPAEITEDLLKDATRVVFQEYDKLGATDQVAKGPELKKVVRAEAELTILIG
jgi:hypothetical protein